MVSSKKRSLVLIIAVLFTLTILPTAYAYATPEIIVDVYVNNHDEDYVRNIVLDDGKRIGDHRYRINYVAQNISTYSLQYELEYYFDYVAWITRADGISLSLDPKDSVRNNYTLADEAWETLSSPSYGFALSSNWTNEESLENQYYCHVQLARSKAYWNLEPWRPVVSWSTMLESLCNPE